MDIKDHYDEGFAHAIETFTEAFKELEQRMQALENLVSARDRVYEKSKSLSSTS